MYNKILGSNKALKSLSYYENNKNIFIANLQNWVKIF